MEVFNVTAKIKYKNNFFYVLINKDCQKYFVKEFEDGSILYPTVEEFKKLNEIFNKKQACAALKIGENVNVEPKLIVKGKKVIALGLAIVSLGIAVPSIVGEFVDDSEIVVEKIENNEEKVEVQYQEMGYDFHELQGYEGHRLYRIHKYVLPTRNERITECESFKEFAEASGTKLNPTYEEVWDTIINNTGIDENYKIWLLDGLENLQKAMPNLDLTILNYNLNRLNIKTTSIEEVNYGNPNGSLAGRYDSDTGIVYFSKTEDEEFNRFVILHETLGHCISEATFQKPADEKYKIGEYSYSFVHITHDKIVVSDSMFIMKCFDTENKDGRKFEMLRVGSGLEEGKADSIARIAMGNDRTIGSSYLEQSEQLRIMCETVGIDLQEFIENGGTELLSNKMQENGVENSLEYIYSNDICVTAKRSDMIELISSRTSFKENVLNFLKDYADGKTNDADSRKKLIERLSKILANGNGYSNSLLVRDEILMEAEKVGQLNFSEER